jgi:hypothetical protein
MKRWYEKATKFAHGVDQAKRYFHARSKIIFSEPIRKPQMYYPRLRIQ